MIKIRRAEERGATKLSWLDSRHTFSFADYWDSDWMGFRVLRVINDDRVAPGAGFGRHGHRDMEIVTYVLDGALEHKDSTGTGSVLRAGDVQRMTAGTGILHSEFNERQDRTVHFLQIWIMPNQQGLAPSYDERHLSRDSRRGKLELLVSPEGRDGTLSIHQDIELYTSILGGGERVQHRLRPGRYGFVQLATGAAVLNGLAMRAGDGAVIAEETELELTSATEAELLLFDLP